VPLLSSVATHEDGVETHPSRLKSPLNICSTASIKGTFKEMRERLKGGDVERNFLTVIASEKSCSTAMFIKFAACNMGRQIYGTALLQMMTKYRIYESK
jgi:hypothetical protein